MRGADLAINKGVAPPVMTTPVGQMRALLGDMTYTELVPPEVGFGNYVKFSDEEIEAFLAASDSQEGALFLAYMSLAGQAALESKNVKDLDLQVDLTKRATDLRLIAFGWRDRADALAADVFEMFDVSIDNGCGCTPEGSPGMVCGGCSNGVRFL